MSLASSIGLSVSLALVAGFGAAAWSARNSPSFSLMRLGLALEDRDHRRAARFLDLDGAGIVHGGVDDGVAVEIGAWRAMPAAHSVVDVSSNGATGVVELQGRCGATITTAQAELQRVPAGAIDLTLFELPVYDWRIVGVTSESLCNVARACGAEAVDACAQVALR